jgi:hypothetical protein
MSGRLTVELVVRRGLRTAALRVKVTGAGAREFGGQDGTWGTQSPSRGALHLIVAAPTVAALTVAAPTVADMAHLVRYQERAGHRYRIVEINRGYVLSFTIVDDAGGPPHPQAWLYQTRAAAEAGLRFVALMNAWWDAAAGNGPLGNLPADSERAALDHARVVERLGDRPLTGAEVRSFPPAAVAVEAEPEPAEARFVT